MNGERTIRLRVQPLNLSPDWIVAVIPAVMVLQSGEQRAVTVTTHPGVAMSGSVVRVPVEGYADERLIDGVAFAVLLPERTAHQAPVRVFLPLLRR